MIVAKRYWYYNLDDLLTQAAYLVKPLGNTSFSLGFYSFADAEFNRLLYITVYRPEIYKFDYKF